MEDHIGGGNKNRSFRKDGDIDVQDYRHIITHTYKNYY